MAKIKPATFGVKRPSSDDPLAVQISVRLQLPRGRKPSRKLVQQAIDYRIEHGEDHPFAETKIIRWRNPSRKGKLASWRQGNQSDAWATLAKFIRHTNVSVFTVRSRKGNRK